MILIAFNQDNKLKIMKPLVQVDVQIIADKDVPSGIFYKFIDSDDPSFPKTKEHRNLWTMEINESNKDGVGLTKQEFNDKYPNLNHMGVKP